VGVGWVEFLVGLLIEFLCTEKGSELLLYFSLYLLSWVSSELGVCLFIQYEFDFLIIAALVQDNCGITFICSENDY